MSLQLSPECKRPGVSIPRSSFPQEPYLGPQTLFSSLPSLRLQPRSPLCPAHGPHPPGRKRPRNSATCPQVWQSSPRRLRSGPRGPLTVYAHRELPNLPGDPGPDDLGRVDPSVFQPGRRELQAPSGLVESQAASVSGVQADQRGLRPQAPRCQHFGAAAPDHQRGRGPRAGDWNQGELEGSPHQHRERAPRLLGEAGPWEGFRGDFGVESMGGEFKVWIPGGKLCPWVPHGHLTTRDLSRNVRSWGFNREAGFCVLGRNWRNRDIGEHLGTQAPRGGGVRAQLSLSCRGTCPEGPSPVLQIHGLGKPFGMGGSSCGF